MYNLKPRETKAAQSKQVVANEDEEEPQETQCGQHPFEVAPQFLTMACMPIEFIACLDGSSDSWCSQLKKGFRTQKIAQR